MPVLIFSHEGEHIVEVGRDSVYTFFLQKPIGKIRTEIPSCALYHTRCYSIVAYPYILPESSVNPGASAILMLKDRGLAELIGKILVVKGSRVLRDNFLYSVDCENPYEKEGWCGRSLMVDNSEFIAYQTHANTVCVASVADRTHIGAFYSLFDVDHIDLSLTYPYLVTGSDRYNVVRVWNYLDKTCVVTLNKGKKVVGNRLQLGAPERWKCLIVKFIGNFLYCAFQVSFRIHETLYDILEDFSVIYHTQYTIPEYSRAVYVGWEGNGKPSKICIQTNRTILQEVCLVNFHKIIGSALDPDHPEIEEGEVRPFSTFFKSPIHDPRILEKIGGYLRNCSWESPNLN